MYGAVGSLALIGVLGPLTWVQFPLKPLDLICVMTPSNLCTYTFALANQAIHPFVVGNWYRQFVGGNSALRGVRGGEVGGWLLVRTGVLHLGLHGADKT